MEQLLPSLPFFFVSRELVTERIQKYLDEKHPVLSQAQEKPETKSIWYSREHIELLLAEMKHYGANGLRIYFGSYEAGHESSPDQLCLLMVPTVYNDETQKITDLIAEEQADFSGRNGIAKSGANWAINGMPVEQGKAMNYNFGAACPPVCNYIMDYKFPH